MRVWTDGKAVIGWLPVGKLRIDLDDASNSVFETGPDPDRKQADALQDIELVAPSPKKGKDLLDDFAETPIDAIATSEKELAAILDDGDVPELYVGAPKAKKPTKLPLTGAGTQVDWPENTMWAASKAPDPSTTDAFVATGARSIRLAHNAHGLVATCDTTGHVAVLRPGSKSFDFILRLPSHEQTTVRAVATEQGVLATLVVEGRHALVVHLEPDGTVLGRWPEQSFGWGVATSGLLGGHLLAYEDQSQSVSLLRLPDLKELHRRGLGTAIIDVASSADGTTFTLGAPNQVFVGKVDAEEEKFSLDDPHAVAAFVAYAQNDETTRVSRYRPEQSQLPTSVAFSALDSAAAPWTAKAGEPFELVLTFRSAGVVGQGIVIEVGGAAVDDGHVELERVTTDEEDVALEGHRAELPELRLVQGLTYPLDPKPKKAEDKEVAKIALEATHFELRLHGKAKKAGRPLFWVAVGALEGTAPVKRTRPFMIE